VPCVVTDLRYSCAHKLVSVLCVLFIRCCVLCARSAALDVWLRDTLGEVVAVKDAGASPFSSTRKNDDTDMESGPFAMARTAANSSGSGGGVDGSGLLVLPRAETLMKGWLLATMRGGVGTSDGAGGGWVTVPLSVLEQIVSPMLEYAVVVEAAVAIVATMHKRVRAKPCCGACA